MASGDDKTTPVWAGVVHMIPFTRAFGYRRCKRK